jgi:hypothetical protein
MQLIARERGGECLSRRYGTSMKKLRWRCRKGHEWKAIPSHIKTGTWCPECWAARRKARLKKEQRITFENVKSIAKERGGRCLSKRYVNNLTKLRFRCERGHEWETIGNHVKRGSWCPRCFRIRKGLASRLTIEDMRDLARKKGGKCLSKEYENQTTKLKWRCSEGHEWESSPYYIKHRRLKFPNWCPVCTIIEKGEERRRSLKRRYGSAED